MNTLEDSLQTPRLRKRLTGPPRAAAANPSRNESIDPVPASPAGVAENPEGVPSWGPGRSVLGPHHMPGDAVAGDVPSMEASARL